MGLLKYKRIYVAAPYHYASGGPELAHQLVDYLRNKGREAYIVYINYGKIEAFDLSVTSVYNKYNIIVSGSVADDKHNVLVIPEIYLHLIPQFNNIQLCIWWMSVDNAIKRCGSFSENLSFSRSLINKLRIIKNFASYNNRYSIKALKRNNSRLTHFYQAIYIQQFLYNHCIDKVIRLTDYINPEILNNVDDKVEKENIILYNPSKGKKYTKRLIKYMPDYKFIALKGFSREQLNKLFDSAKLYIDFGEFPGKDRLPREAAIHNCCIITGKFGASRYYEDVPIDNKYKFDMLHANYSNIKKCIDDVLENYNLRIDDFEYLRETIKHEQENFYREIDNIFI